MLPHCHFDDADALRAHFTANQDPHAIAHQAAIARGRPFVVGGVPFRIEWDDAMLRPQVRPAEPTVGTWLADPRVQDRLRQILSGPRRYASVPEFVRALRSADRKELLDDLAKGVGFSVGGIAARLVWRGQQSRLAPPPPRATFSASEQAWRQRIEACLDAVRDELPAHRHLGEAPCLNLIEQFGPTWPRRSAGSTALSTGPVTAASAPSPDDRGSNAALRRALDHYVAEPGIDDAERDLRDTLVKPKLLALRSNGGNALHLCSLGLTSLPDVFDALPAVQHVSLEGNALTAVPPSLCRMPALSSLDLSHNDLNALPGEFDQMAALRELRLDGNDFATLPEPVRGLRALSRLSVAGNRLECMPDWLGELASLTALNLHGNRIADLPASIAQLQALRRLDWTDNGIARPPSALSSILPSCFVDLRGNPQLAAVLAEQRRAGIAPRPSGAIYDLAPTPSVPQPPFAS